MKKKRIYTSPEQRREVVELHREGMTHREIAKVLGITYHNSRKIVSRYKDGNVGSYHLGPLEKIPEDIAPIWDRFEKVYHQDIMVCGDLHIPYCSMDMLNKMVAVAKKFNISKLILGGDTIDNKAISHWDYEDKKVDLEAAFQVANRIFESLLKTFDKIYMIAGSHDKWAIKRLLGKIELPRYVRMFIENVGGKVKVSNYHYLILNDKWRITHPKSFAQNPILIPTRLMTKYLMNVIGLHSHYSGVRYHESGQFLGFNLGGMTDEDRHEYKSLWDTNYPKWRKQFCMIKNNYAYIFDEKETDWDFWLGKK